MATPITIAVVTDPTQAPPPPYLAVGGLPTQYAAAAQQLLTDAAPLFQEGATLNNTEVQVLLQDVAGSLPVGPAAAATDILSVVVGALKQKLGLFTIIEDATRIAGDVAKL